MLTLYKRHRGVAMFLISKLAHTNRRLWIADERLKQSHDNVRDHDGYQS